MTAVAAMKDLDPSENPAGAVGPPKDSRDFPYEVWLEIMEYAFEDYDTTAKVSDLACVNHQWQFMAESCGYASRQKPLRLTPDEIPDFVHIFHHDWRSYSLKSIRFDIACTFPHRDSDHLIAKYVVDSFERLFWVLKDWKSHKGLDIQYSIAMGPSIIKDPWHGLSCDFSGLPKVPIIRALSRCNSETGPPIDTSSLLSLLLQLPEVEHLGLRVTSYTSYQYTIRLPKFTSNITSLKLDLAHHHVRQYPYTTHRAASHFFTDSLLHRSGQLEHLHIDGTGDTVRFFDVVMIKNQAQQSPTWPKLRSLIVHGIYYALDEKVFIYENCALDSIRSVFPALSRLRIKMWHWSKLSIDSKLGEVDISWDLNEY